jgi:hypothetical protein
MSLFNHFFGKKPTQQKAVDKEQAQKQEFKSETNDLTSDKPASNKRSIRVFISSTFLDMIEECDALMTQIYLSQSAIKLIG